MSTTTFSRLATANAYDSTVAHLQDRQNTLAKLQQSLSSGKKSTPRRTTPPAPHAPSGH
jgi:hypothetical protein